MCENQFSKRCPKSLSLLLRQVTNIYSTSSTHHGAPFAASGLKHAHFAQREEAIIAITEITQRNGAYSHSRTHTHTFERSPKVIYQKRTSARHDAQTLVLWQSSWTQNERVTLLHNAKKLGAGRALALSLSNTSRSFTTPQLFLRSHTNQPPEMGRAKRPVMVVCATVTLKRDGRVTFIVMGQNGTSNLVVLD